MICNPVLESVIGCNTSGGAALAILMARLFRILMVLGGLAMLLFFAWGGINWITAGGDKGKVEEAKNRLSNAVIGMIALTATVAIALLLEFVFGFNLLNPTLPGPTN